MLDNYFNETCNKLLEKSKMFQSTGKISINSPTSVNFTKNFLPSLKEELDSLSRFFFNKDSKVMVENYILLKNTIYEEICKKIGTSRNNNQLKETLEKNLDSQVDFFIKCFQTVENSKINLIKEKIDIYNLVKKKLNKLEINNKANSPRNSININNNIINKGNIFNDQEFISTINLLSCNIKEFYIDYKKGSEILKQNNDILIENILSLKNQFVEFNNMILSNSSSVNIKLKLNSTKEKSSHILESLSKLQEIRHNISNNIKSFEKNVTNFYDDSKTLFKTLKNIHSNENNYVLLNNVVKNNLNLQGDRGRNKHKSVVIKGSEDSLLKQNKSISERNKVFTTTFNNNNNKNLSLPKYDSQQTILASRTIDSMMEKDINQRINQLKERNLELINEMSSINEQIVGLNKESSYRKEDKNKLEYVNSPQLHGSNTFSSKQTSSIERKDFKLIQPEKLVKHKQYPTLNYPNISGKILTVDNSKQNVPISNVKSKTINSSIMNKNTNRTNMINSSIGNVNSITSTTILEHLIALSEKVCKFIKEMINLQDAISKKVSNVKDLKQSFETNKAELLHYANECLKMKKNSDNMLESSSLVKNTGKNEIISVVEIHGFSSPEKEERNNKEMPQSSVGAERIPNKGDLSDNFKEMEISPNQIKKPVPKEKNKDSVNVDIMEKELARIKEGYMVEKEKSKEEIISLNEKINSLVSERNKLKEIESNYNKNNDLKISNLEKENSNLKSENKDCKNTITLLNNEIEELNLKIHEYKLKLTEFEELIEFSNNEKLTYIQKNAEIDKSSRNTIKEIEEKFIQKIKILEEKISLKDHENIIQIKEYEDKQSYLIKMENENSSLKISLNSIKEALLTEQKNVENINKKKDYTLSLLNKAEVHNQDLEKEVERLKEMIQQNEQKFEELKEESKRLLNDKNKQIANNYLNLEVSFFEIQLNNLKPYFDVKNRLNENIFQQSEAACVTYTKSEVDNNKRLLEINIELEEKVMNLNKLLMESQSKESNYNEKLSLLNNDLEKGSMKSKDLEEIISNLSEEKQNLLQEICDLKKLSESIIIEIISLLRTTNSDNGIDKNLYSNSNHLIVREIHCKLEEMKRKNQSLQNENLQVIESIRDDYQKKLINLENEKENLLSEMKDLKEFKQEYSSKFSFLINESRSLKEDYEKKLIEITNIINQKEEIIFNLNSQINNDKLCYFDIEKAFESRISVLNFDLNGLKETNSNLEKDLYNKGNEIKELNDKLSVLNEEIKQIQSNYQIKVNQEEKLKEELIKHEANHKMLIRENNDMNNKYYERENNLLNKISVLEVTIKDLTCIINNSKTSNHLEIIQTNFLEISDVNKSKHTIEIENKIEELEQNLKVSQLKNIELDTKIIYLIDIIKYLYSSVTTNETFEEIFNNSEEENKENYKNLSNLIESIEINTISEDIVTDFKILCSCVFSLLFGAVEQIKINSLRSNSLYIETVSLSLISDKKSILDNEIQLLQENIKELNKKLIMQEKKYHCFISRIHEEINFLLLNLSKLNINITINNSDNEENQLLSIIRFSFETYDKELTKKENLLSKSIESNKKSINQIEQSMKIKYKEILEKEIDSVKVLVKKESEDEIIVLQKQLTELQREFSGIPDSLNNQNEEEKINNIEKKKDLEIEELKEKNRELLQINDTINNQLIIIEEKFRKEKENFTLKEEIIQEELKTKEIQILERIKELESLNRQLSNTKEKYNNEILNLNKDFEKLNDEIEKQEKKFSEEKENLNLIIDQLLKEKQDEENAQEEIEKLKMEREKMLSEHQDALKNIEEQYIKEKQDLLNNNDSLKQVSTVENNTHLINEKNNLILQIEILKNDQISQIKAISENFKEEITNLQTKLFHKEIELNDCKNKLIKYQIDDKLTIKFDEVCLQNNENTPTLKKKKSSKKLIVMAKYKDKTKNELRSEIERLVQKCSDLEEDLTSKRESCNLLENEYERTNYDNIKLKENNKQFEKMIKDLNIKIVELEKKINENNNELGKNKIDIKLKHTEINTFEKNLKLLYNKINDIHSRNETELFQTTPRDKKKKGRYPCYDSNLETNVLIENYFSENKSSKYYFDEIFNVFDLYNKKVRESVIKYKILETQVNDERKKDELILNSLDIKDELLDFNLQVDGNDELASDFQKIIDDLNETELKEKIGDLLHKVEEINKASSRRLIRLLKTISQLKGQLKEVLDKSFRNNEQYYYDPNKYKIYCFKTAYNIKWCLLIFHKDEDKISFNDMVWVTADSLKVENYERVNNISFEKEQEISNLRSVNLDLIDKLSAKEEEISMYKNEIHKLTKNNNFIPLEKYEKILDQLNEEQKAHLQLFKNYELIKKENETIKQALLDKSKDNINCKNIEQVNQTIISQIDKNQTKFLDDGVEVNDLFLETQFYYGELIPDQKKDSKSGENNSNKSKDSIKSPKNYIIKNQETNINNENAYQHSFKRKSGDSFKETIYKMEENERLFREQLTKIKEELREMRIQRDNYKKLYDKSLTIKDEKKKELIFMLKQAIEKLVEDITLSNKSKELVIVILKMIDYSEEEITEFFAKKDGKKKSFLGGLFGAKK